MAMQGTFGSGGEVVFNLRIDTKQANIDVAELTKNFNALEQIILRSLTLTRKMGLPDDVSKAINSIQRMLLLTNQLNIALNALAAASATNPAGAILAITGMAITAFSYADAITYDSRG